MCSGTLDVMYRVNSLFFKVIFWLNSMALMEEISNSCVYGIPTENIFIIFVVGAS